MARLTAAYHANGRLTDQASTAAALVKRREATALGGPRSTMGTNNGQQNGDDAIAFDMAQEHPDFRHHSAF